MLPHRKNNLIDTEDLKKPSNGGDERRIEILKEVLENGTFLPKQVLHEDIDKAFKEWVESLEVISDDNVPFPTMVLYSNQRFSEYTQSWEFTDANDNLILDFKTVSRESNPQYGKIENGLWNIPGNEFFMMKRQIVLDDNGSESFLDLKMKMPTAVDYNFKVSIFTGTYHKLNEFNEKMIRLFNSRQVYITPNGHYMPMVLDNISDESSYSIDDRQYYGQSYSIKVMGYILHEDDFKIEQTPMKTSVYHSVLRRADRDRSLVEITDIEDNSLNVEITFPVDVVNCKFEFDDNVIIEGIELTNVYRNNSITLWINDEKNTLSEGITFKNGDEIRMKVKKTYADKKSIILLKCKQINY